jgi:hypothetical protein
MPPARPLIPHMNDKCSSPPSHTTGGFGYISVLPNVWRSESLPTIHTHRVVLTICAVLPPLNPHKGGFGYISVMSMGEWE